MKIFSDWIGEGIGRKDKVNSLRLMRNSVYLRIYLPILWSRFSKDSNSKKFNVLDIFLKVFPSPRSHKLKMKTIRQLGGTKAWVETGTYVGDGAMAISQFAEVLHTIEPSRELSDIAKQKLIGIGNVEIHVGTSEVILSEILESLVANGCYDICFWLDGHYSGGETFSGETATPIKSELETIANYLKCFTNLRIMIDDVRCFNPKIPDYKFYPKIQYLLDYAKLHKFSILFTRDICIMKKS